jgi:serine/threonine protein kinase
LRVEFSLISVNQLLRGLLAPDPEQRLSASKAIKLPVFDKFRGTQIPVLSPSKSMDEYDTDIFDEGSPVMHSIKSLEGRSIVIRRPMDGTSPTPSAFSIRLEGGGSSVMSKNKIPAISAKANALNKYVADMIQEEPALLEKTPVARQRSFDYGSKFSVDDRMSPLQSPKKPTPLRGLNLFPGGQTQPNISKQGDLVSKSDHQH